MDIYEEHENKRELERKIKLKDWIEFKNEGIASIFAIISFISASKLLHYKLTDVWYRRDAIVMNVDYLGVKSKYARFKFLIMNKDEAFEEIE